MKIQRLFGSWALLLGIFTFISCDNEVSTIKSGDKIMVRFSFSDSSDTDETRSWGALESQTVAVPVSDDLYVSATLEALPEAPTRATTKDLKPATKVWIGAYNGTPSANDVPVASAIYISSGSSVTPEDGYGLNIDPGTYTFVVYSYNTDTLVPPYEKTLTIDPSHDLMWCRVQHTLSSENPTVFLPTLKHLFPEISVVITCTNYSFAAALDGISGVTIAPNDSAKLDVATGTLTAANPVLTPNYISSWTYSEGRKVATSALTTVYTGTTGGANPNKITLTIGSIVLENVATFVDLKPVFPNLNLNPAKSYKLTINMRKDRLKFAASNIYWDDIASKVTFDPYTSTPSQESMSKQGIMFRWGSLIGVSNQGMGELSTPWNPDVPIYVPTGVQHPTAWTQMKVAGAAAFVNNLSKWSGTNFQSIPYAIDNNVNSSNNPRDNNYLTFMNGNDSTAFYKGDICQYLDDDYRMPTSSELGDLDLYEGREAIPHYNENPNHFATTDPSGQTAMLYGILFSSSTNSKSISWFFPASGYRSLGGPLSSSDGSAHSVGLAAFYWTSSRYNKSLAWNFRFSGTNIGLPRETQDAKGDALAVRCILKE